MEKLSQLPDGEDSLAVTIGFLLRYAREKQGYSFSRIDAELARALTAEAAQRVAITNDRPISELPPAHEIFEILSVVLDDVKDEARKVLQIAMN